MNLRAVAAEQVRSVIEEATEAARREAVEILKTRLTDLILEQATGSAQPQPEQPPCPKAAVPNRGWYLYGLTWPSIAADMAGSPGIGGAPLRPVALGDVAALVSPLEDEGSWRSADDGEVDLHLLAPRVAEHQRVLEDILERGPVLPLRFGVMYPDLRALIDAVQARSKDMARELHRLDGMQEWGLTVEWGGLRSASRAEVGCENGRQYLSRRHHDRGLVQRAESEAGHAAEAVHRALAVRAHGAVLHACGRPGRGERQRVLRASYLVHRSETEDFRAAAGEALAEAPRDLQLSGELTGPWPAYNFVDVRLGEAG